MNSKTFLVNIMQTKANTIKKLNDTIMYFTNTDKKYLLTLNNKIANIIYDIIIENIEKYNTSGLGEPTCPFCIIFSKCNNCFYSKEHQPCLEINSTYHIITQYLLPNGKHLKIFNNDFYKSIIKGD